MAEELSPGMQNVEASIASERKIQEYMDRLDISEEDLKRWQNILDLGSGTEQEFAKGIKTINPKARVVSLDPRQGLAEEIDLESYFPEEKDARLRGRRNPEENTVAGLAQELPFKDGSFDAVLALHSVPQYLKEPEINLALGEIVRVLKAGGEARIHPVLESKDLESVNQFLRQRQGDIKGAYKEKNHLFVIKKS